MKINDENKIHTQKFSSTSNASSSKIATEHNPIVILIKEHDRILQTNKAFLKFSQQLTAQKAQADAEKFIQFFWEYVDDYHHAKEEKFLFMAMIQAKSNELYPMKKMDPMRPGPLKSMIHEHHGCRTSLHMMKTALRFWPYMNQHIHDQIFQFSVTITAHIDRENLTYFPQAENEVLNKEEFEKYAEESYQEDIKFQDKRLELESYSDYLIKKYLNQ